MDNGWGYLILFGILVSPLVFWAWHSIGKSIKRKGPYDDLSGLV